MLINWKYKIAHISVTFEPEQEMPFHDSPQGSPPFAVHFVSCCGEFRLVYKTPRAETVHQNITVREYSIQTYSSHKSSYKVYMHRVLYIQITANYHIYIVNDI